MLLPYVTANSIGAITGLNQTSKSYLIQAVKGGPYRFTRSKSRVCNLPYDSHVIEMSYIWLFKLCNDELNYYVLLSRYDNALPFKLDHKHPR